VVTPVAIATAHRVPAASVDVAAVSVNVAVAVPDWLAAIVNVVVPHPEVVGVAGEDSAKSGNTIATLSAMASGALKAKMNAIAELAAVTGLSIVSMLCMEVTVSP
jgi:hypothetical protein